MRFTWPRQAQVVVLAVGGTWLLTRALVLGSYSQVEFAIQAGTLSVLSSVILLARLRARSPEEKDPHSDSHERPPLWRRLRYLSSAVLLLATLACMLWWVTQISHGMFLKRLQFGLDPHTRVAGILWMLLLVISPAAPPSGFTTQSTRLRGVMSLAVLALLFWTYPYTDPLSRSVQWSGLYLPVVVALSSWNLIAWLRGDRFIRGWVNFFAYTIVPHDLFEPTESRNDDKRPSRVWLALICAGAMAMQAINLTWGLPVQEPDREFRPIHPDEKVTHEQAWRLYIDPAPVVFARGGAAYYRIGLFARDLATYLTDPEFVPRLQILIMRGLNILAVGGYVLTVYGCGVRIFDQRTGLLAALLMAFFPGNVVTSHVARPEALFIFCSSVVLYVALRAISSASATQWLQLGGFLLGSTIGVKITGVGLAVPLLTALALRRPSALEFLSLSSRIFLAAWLGFFLSSFESFFYFSRFLEGMLFTRHLQGARGAGDILTSIGSYLGPVSAYVWTVIGSLLLWIGMVLAVRRPEGLVVVSFVVAGHLISFVQRDVTLRSHVHLSSAVSLLVAHVLIRCSGIGPRGVRRGMVGLGTICILLIAEESVGHVAYLRFGCDARTKAAEWIEEHVVAERSVGITPLFHGDWGSCPPLDETRRRVVILPVGEPYDASAYLDKHLDYIVLCDITLPAAERNHSVAAFFEEVQRGETYTLERTFVSSCEGFHVAEWLGWPMHVDWRYTRPNLYLYARIRPSGDTKQTPEYGP